MITQIITALISNYMTTAFVIGVVIAVIHILSHRDPRTAEFISGTFLNKFVIWAIGVVETINFVMIPFSVTTPRRPSGGRRARSSSNSRCAASASA